MTKHLQPGSIWRQKGAVREVEVVRIVGNRIDVRDTDTGIEEPMRRSIFTQSYYCVRGVER